MHEHDWLAERFEENRGHLRGVAYRMLGSVGEADDAVQETWLRLSRSPSDEIRNLGGWLTTVLARVCLDMLRSRAARREEPLLEAPAASDPEREALLADSVGLALLVVLDRLAPAERIAFVLHDLFAVPFEDIAPIVGRSLAATRQLASRARRRVRGADPDEGAGLAAQRQLVQKFLAALRAGDLNGLLAILDPDLLVRVDGSASEGGVAREVHGAAQWARGAIVFSKTMPDAYPVLVDGRPGVILAPHGRLWRAVRFTFAPGRIAQIDILADPSRLAALSLSL